MLFHLISRFNADAPRIKLEYIIDRDFFRYEEGFFFVIRDNISCNKTLRARGELRKLDETKRQRRDYTIYIQLQLYTIAIINYIHFLRKKNISFLFCFFLL